jgi:hypothetical protein
LRTSTRAKATTTAAAAAAAETTSAATTKSYKHASTQIINLRNIMSPPSVPEFDEYDDTAVVVRTQVYHPITRRDSPSYDTAGKLCTPLLSDSQIVNDRDCTYQVLKRSNTLESSYHTDKAANVATSSGRKMFARLRVPLLFVCLALLPAACIAVMLYYTSLGPVELGDNSVYVPGGGFSGFWYTMGRLQSVPYPYAYDYYCYSAGCLVVVAVLQNRSMDTVLDMATDAQKRWLRGEISRYEVVPDFVDNLLYNGDPEMLDAVAHGLPRLNVITTTRKGIFGIDKSIRTADNIESLREMLLQTTWIPYGMVCGVILTWTVLFLYHPILAVLTMWA